MKRTLIAWLGLVVVAAAAQGSPPQGAVDTRQIAAPNPRLSRPLGREPTLEELIRLQGIIGRSQIGVLQQFGHPKSIEKTSVGRERWCYAWGADGVFIDFQNGRAVRSGETEYQTGYVPPYAVNP